VARRMSPGRLVVLESTTYPGTTDELVRPLLEASGFNAGRDFLLAFSPERIDPGNEEFTFSNTPKVVGGHTREATAAAALFHEQLVEKVVVVSSCRAAELSKLLENTFRHVNVALVNEIAMLSHEMGIDVWEVLDAAATKPFGYMPFYPGPGVGGHCIPVDPTYLAWQVRRDAGQRFRILEQAQEINAQMPAYVAARIGGALNDAGKAVRGADVLVLGVAYKADVGDVRDPRCKS
jgi:UDP-N-acetyl-D-glucosamine dehydrogenase